LRGNRRGSLVIKFWDTRRVKEYDRCIFLLPNNSIRQQLSAKRNPLKSRTTVSRCTTDRLRNTPSLISHGLRGRRRWGEFSLFVRGATISEWTNYKRTSREPPPCKFKVISLYSGDHDGKAVSQAGDFDRIGRHLKQVQGMERDRRKWSCRNIVTMSLSNMAATISLPNAGEHMVKAYSADKTPSFWSALYEGLSRNSGQQIHRCGEMEPVSQPQTAAPMKSR